MRLYLLTNSYNEDCKSSSQCRWLSANESLSFTVNPFILRCITGHLLHAINEDESYLKNKNSRRLTVDYIDNSDYLPARSGELIGRHWSSIIVIIDCQVTIAPARSLFFYGKRLDCTMLEISLCDIGTWHEHTKYTRVRKKKLTW